MQTLSRGLAVLDLLAEREEGISVTELAQQMTLSTSVASRLLKTLTHSGYVSQRGHSRRYYLAEKVVWLSHSYFQHVPLRKPVQPVLQQLVAQTQETAHLAVLMHQSALVLEDVKSPAMLRVDSEVGRVVPLPCTAIGKCLMAFHALPVPEKLEQYTDRTITDPAQLAEHLHQIREQGYALDDEEFNIGVRCLAAPVLDSNSSIMATVGISGPAARLGHDRVAPTAEIVIEAAKQISAILFGG